MSPPGNLHGLVDTTTDRSALSGNLPTIKITVAERQTFTFPSSDFHVEMSCRESAGADSERPPL